MQPWDLLQTVEQRLRYARMQAGFDSAVDAAQALGIKEGTYRTYERGAERQGRAPPARAALKIAKAFGVDLVWLMTGEGAPRPPAPVDERLAALFRAIEAIPRERLDDALPTLEAVVASYVNR